MRAPGDLPQLMSDKHSPGRAGAAGHPKASLTTRRRAVRRRRPLSWIQAGWGRGRGRTGTYLHSSPNFSSSIVTSPFAFTVTWPTTGDTKLFPGPWLVIRNWPTNEAEN
jgi:hypothetical protein